MRTISVFYAIHVIASTQYYATWAFKAFSSSRRPKPMIRMVARSGRERHLSPRRTTLLASNGGDDWVEKAIGGLRSHDLVARVSAGSSFSPTTSADSSQFSGGGKSPELSVATESRDSDSDLDTDLANDNVGGTEADQSASQRGAGTSNLTALLSGTPGNRFNQDRSQY